MSTLLLTQCSDARDAAQKSQTKGFYAKEESNIMWDWDFDGAQITRIPTSADDLDWDVLH